ncbi:Nitroreductase family protein [Pseudonocardia ammonioxydans]|uniref:Nitroreductase family protein n=1 Tax=Pseudonocardia ammonioxydans TaxID=260086 RepID=A0A1I5E8Q0_PSUAM|nr:nitroreductase [Pseudonocardia ammonioxydans]SFO07656.1 Nitroreductase family protein [Pseudonocardia ammonioxydans]
MDTTCHEGRVAGALGLDADATGALLALATRAPSLHNSQPWRFGLFPDRIELHTDPARRLPAADPGDRELRIGCGAALFTLRLGLLGAGIRPMVSRFPDPRDPGLVAVVRHGGTALPSAEQQRLLDAVPRRRTNRRPFRDTAVPGPVRSALRRAAFDEGAWLQLVTDPAELAELGRLAREAHALQTADPAFAAEMSAWTGHAGDRDDGVPATAGGPCPPPNQPWVRRDFGGDAHPRPAPAAFEAEPLIAVLSVHTDGPREDVRAGEALQRVLLTATAEGLSASFLSQVVEVADVREQVRRLLGGIRPPQLVLRLGHGVPVPATPRRAPGTVTGSG